MANLDVLICSPSNNDSEKNGIADFSNFADTKILLEIKDIELLKGYIHKRMDGYGSNIIKGEELIQILEQFGFTDSL